MSIRNVIARKLLTELDSVWALAQYPWRKEDLIERLASSLSRVNIETTNVCNANCIFCAYQYQERAKGTMEMNLFRKVVDEFVECGGGELMLTPTVGEPLVDRFLLERLRYARSQQKITNISMYSNMISLDRVGANNLVKSGINRICVSTSGFDEKMYLRVYRSKMYKQMLRNVKAFAEENNAAGRPVDFVIEMRIDRPLREVKAYPDLIDVAKLVGSENVGVKLRYDNWSGKIRQSALSGNMKLRRFNLKPRISACGQLFGGPAVFWDGTVGGCGCRDVNANELIIGNVREQHLADIWFGEEIRKLREEFTTERVRDICTQCTHYSNLSCFLKRSMTPPLETWRPNTSWRARRERRGTTE